MFIPNLHKKKKRKNWTFQKHDPRHAQNKLNSPIGSP